MTLAQSIILGLLQGVTEFLPISSSAHLILIPWFFQFQGGTLTFDVMLHFATLFATLSLYGKSLLTILREAISGVKRGKLKELLLTKIIVASFPACFVGYFFNDFIEKNLRGPYVCAFMLVSVAILMFVAEYKKRSKNRDINYTTALIMGTAQALALIPGTSRSGITITFGLLMGLERKRTVDFSFLISIPVILGASFYEIKHLDFRTDNLIIYVIGMISATIAGVVSLKFLISYLKKYSLKIFAYYRIFVAILVLSFSK
ncbi:MAG: undecaprenyl-diphosphate phosphatase [Deltaproteobacteria bacterium]|nr:undecaprenyl-diphosphate phosphatase [Deltaproteobacteria bacterium]